MRAGKLRHRIRIERRVQGQDLGTGEMLTDTWALVADDVPAEIVPLSGREFVAGGGVQAGVDTRITIRYLGDVFTAMRVVNPHDAGGRVYEIRAVLPDPDNARHLTLMVQSGVTSG